MSEPKPTWSTARDAESMWKHRELIAYSCAFIQAGLALLDRGVGYFGSDDVPESAIPGPDSPGIAGSAVTMLRNASVIVDHFGSHPSAEPPVNHGRRKSKREAANGRKVSTYEIASRAVAESFLTRNGQALAPRQGVLAI